MSFAEKRGHAAVKNGESNVKTSRRQGISLSSVTKHKNRFQKSYMGKSMKLMTKAKRLPRNGHQECVHIRRRKREELKGLADKTPRGSRTGKNTIKQRRGVKEFQRRRRLGNRKDKAGKKSF